MRKKGRADGHDEADGLYSQSANAPKVPSYCKYHNEHINALY